MVGIFVTSSMHSITTFVFHLFAEMNLSLGKRTLKVREKEESVDKPKSRKRGKLTEKLQFCTFKSKLWTVTRNKRICKMFENCVLIAHSAFQRASSFFRLYCLSLSSNEEFPDITESTMKACFNQVCKKNPSGAKTKDRVLEEKLGVFWKETFSKIHPDKIDMRGMSRTKAILAEQLCENVLVDCNTHFRSRFFRAVLRILQDENNDDERVKSEEESEKKREMQKKANVIVSFSFASK